MKIIFIGILGVATVIALLIVVFSIGGYTYKSPSEQSTKTTSYVTSPSCDAKQSQKRGLQEPFQLQSQAIAEKLVNSPLPLVNGQELYDQYSNLQHKINDLEAEYAC